MGLHTQVIIALILGIKRNGHIFLGLILGIIVGCFCSQENYPTVYKILDFIGQAFINIIQMVVLPLVISAIIIGISNIGDSKQLTKFGSKMLLYYGIITIAAVSIASAAAIILQPGVSARGLINHDVASHIQEYVAGAIQYQKENLVSTDIEQILFDMKKKLDAKDAYLKFNFKYQTIIPYNEYKKNKKIHFFLLFLSSLLYLSCLFILSKLKY